MIYLLQLAIAFGLFSDSLLESNVVIVSKNNKRIGKVIPPGRYKIAVWDKIKKKKPDYCEHLLIKMDNKQIFLTEEALLDSSKECFDRFEHFITGFDGLIDPQNIVFYGASGASFCEIKHTLNIHVFPMDPFNRLYEDEIDPEKNPPQQQSVQRINSKSTKKVDKNRIDDNDQCDVHYHGIDKFKYLDDFFAHWQADAQIHHIDLFMGKAYLNYFLWHNANETWTSDEKNVLKKFSIQLQKVAKKLNTRSQFAMTVLPELYEFCCPTDLANEDDLENCIGHEVANTTVWNGLNDWWDLCEHVNQIMRRNDPLLALFVRWVNGNLWLDDRINLKKKFHQLVEDVKQITDLEEQNILIETKMLEQLASIGQCVNDALKKAKLPIEVEPYSPEFGHIGAELQQICVLFATNKLKSDVAANAWHKCCAEFFEEMWHQWFNRHGIYTKSASELEPDKDSNEDDSDEDEDKKPLLNFNVMPTEQMLIDIFETLINERNWGELKRQKLAIIYKIGNVLERALHDDLIKTLNIMHNCEGYGPKMMEMVKDFCGKNYNRNWTTNAWHQICGVFIWDNWLFNYEMLTVSDMKKFDDQILALVGSGTKQKSKNGNSSITMNVVDSSVLNFIGQILMERVLNDHSGKTLIHFVNSGYSAICNFCANRTAQFSGWEHICVYNMWLFVCKELDKKAVGDFLGILRRMDKIRSIIGIERADWLPHKNKWRLLDEIGTQLQQNMINPMNLKNLKALLVQTWPNLSIFCSIVAKKIETKYGTFFPSWIKVCRAMSALKDMEKTKNNNNNKTPRKGKIQKENKKEVSSNTEGQG